MGRTYVANTTRTSWITHHHCRFQELIRAIIPLTPPIALVNVWDLSCTTSLAQVSPAPPITLQKPWRISRRDRFHLGIQKFKWNQRCSARVTRRSANAMRGEGGLPPFHGLSESLVVVRFGALKLVTSPKGV